MNLDLDIYVIVLLSGFLTVLAFGAVLLLKGGWEAAATGLTLAAGMAFVLSFIALLVAGERTSNARRT